MSDDLPYGVDTIVIPFTWSAPRRRRLPTHGMDYLETLEYRRRAYELQDADISTASSAPSASANETGPGAQDGMQLVRNALCSAASPAAPTSAAGAAGQPTPVTAAQLRAIMPTAGNEADRSAEALNQAMAAHGINTPTQRAAFLAEVSAESKQLRSTVEDLDYYSARRIQQVWPRHFPTEAAAAPYVHNPEALANRVYAGVNGNGDEASGDGYRYRGRGSIQVTGRENYRRVGFENNPEALAEAQNAADSAAAWWQNHGLNGRTSGVLNRAQFDAVTHTVNSGDLQSQERWNAYQRALVALNAGQSGS